MHQEIIDNMNELLHSCDKPFSNLDESDLAQLTQILTYASFEEFEELIKSEECPDFVIMHTKIFASAMLCYIRLREMQKEIQSLN